MFVIKPVKICYFYPCKNQIIKMNRVQSTEIKYSFLPDIIEVPLDEQEDYPIDVSKYVRRSPDSDIRGIKDLFNQSVRREGQIQEQRRRDICERRSNPKTYVHERKTLTVMRKAELLKAMSDRMGMYIR